MATPLPDPGPDDARGPALEDSLGYLFRDTHRLISRHLNARLERAGVGLGQWYLLRALWQEDGITQRELGARIGMGEPNVVTALRGLEEAGLVERRVDPADNRRKIVRLTAKGRALEREFMAIAREVNEQIAAPLSSEERDQLRALIRRVRAHL